MAGSQRTRPYHAGAAGATSIAEAEVLFSAAAARQLICSLPALSVVLRAWVEVLTAFNAGVSNLVTVGWGAIGAASADDYVATVDESQVSLATATGPFAAETAAKDVYVYYTPGDGAASTGKARAFIEYARLTTE
jgi:hypothetical protein